MSNVLVVFATIEGQTGKIAQFIADKARKAGHDVTLVEITHETGPVSLDGVDLAILAAPVHERRHPTDFEVFLAGQRRALDDIRTLLVSVSLSAAFPEGLEEAGEYVTELKMRTNFTPDAEALVAGAIRPSHYDYFATQVVRYVVLRDRDAEADKDEHEFTDWDALADRVSEFLGG
jgi:menaquinone-dependent protoporphyrinogen oxidase